MGCGFCVQALSNSVGALVVDCVVKPVGRQLDYVRRFHDNVEKLREREGDLTVARNRLRQDIEDAERQLQRIYDDVRNVQSKADTILKDVGTLEKEIGQNKRCFNWCPNWIWRYSLSKKAMKKTEDISKLLENPKFCQPGRVGYRDESALPKIGFWCSEEFVRSKSADTASNQIMKYLKDDSITMLGLWGMGGVGKTTLACQVGNQAEKSNLFKKVVIATVSRRPNFEEIQDNIARYLDFDMKNERGVRKDVQDLWLRLKKVESILIILDDVWANINLKERIGIPLGNDHKGCKVLLTTRRQDVCVKVGCQKVVQLGCFDGHEAFTLFAKKAGLNDSADDDKKKLAKEIIEKCDGLPIAIVTLGSALKGQSCNEWGAACWRLKNHRLTEFQDVNEKNAYLCFQESFDYLQSMETKICFFLCSLFPEDYEIYVEDLVRYAWGLKLYVCSDSVEIVRMLVHAEMDNLKNSCLLLACGERHVKMHDMVREFALWKASSKGMSFVIYSEAVETWPKDEGFEHCTAISFKSSQIADAPEGLVFPSLKILLLGVGELPYLMTTSNKFFKGMKALEVCALDGIFISLAGFQFQTNLRTLLLKKCRISDISILGKLKTLQVLSFNSSDMIELPNGIGELVNLRLLELSNCGNLQRIPRSMSRLSNLEELYLDGCSSIKWATDNATENESYSSLLELNSLPKLTVLSLDISLKQLPKGFVFGKLKKFDVCIGIRRQRWYGKGGFETCPISRSLKVETAVEACKQLFEDVESLHLRKVKTLRIDNCKIAELRSTQQGLSHLVRLQSLKVVEIDSCNKWRFLFPMSVANSLGQLQTLEIRSCLGLEEIIQATEVAEIQVPQGLNDHLSFRSLKVVEIDSCNKLRYLFPSSVANSLAQLETLKIKSCLELEEIIQATVVAEVQVQQGHNRHPSFQNVKVVVIDSCNNLKYLFPTSVANSLGKLERLEIKSCLRLEEIIQAATVSDACLQSLEVVVIDSCNNLKYLFRTSVANSLRRLEIRSCLGLEEIIQATTVSDTCLQSLEVVEIDSCNNLKYLFPTSVANSLGQLEILKIKSCLRLEEIIQATTVSDACLQSLEVVVIDSCNNLKYLFPTSVANSLRRLEIKSCLGLEEIIQATTVSDTSLQSLEVVEIDSCNNLKYLFPTSVANSLRQLERLEIKSCLGLEEIIQGTTVSDTCLQSLEVVEIDSCNNLKYLFPTSVAKSLRQLERLEIKSCLGLEEIIQATTVSDTCLQSLEVVDISLRSLRKVHVEKCGSLTSLFSLSHGQSLENLIQLVIRDCDRLEYTFPISMAKGLPQLNEVCLVNLPQFKGGDENDIVLSLRSLRSLQVHGCPQLISFTVSVEIQVQQELNHKVSLQSLIVEILGYKNLKYLFPTSVANSLGQLETLKIKSCLGMEEIIQATEVAEVQVQQGLDDHLSFRSLRVVEIDSCNNLKYLFPTSVANSLGQLERLEIKSCLELEEIIQATEVAEVQVQQGLNRHPSFQSLWFVAIDSCNNLKYLFPTSVANSLGKLERLEIKSCLGLEEIIQATTVSDTCFQSLRVVEIDSCNNLKSLFPTNSLGQLETLKIKSCLGLEEIIQATEVPDISLQSLRKVHVEKCDNLTSLSSLSHGQSLENLIQLVIEDCDRLKYTFPISMAKGLPQLKEVCLVNLPQFEGSDGKDIVLSLRSLRVLKVHGCPQLIPLTISAEIRELELGGTKERKQMCNMVVPELKGSSADMEYLTITNFEDFFDSGYNLSSMRTLRLEALPELRVIWKDPFQVVNFQNLTDLEVYDCRRLRYIFSPTIASNLPQLSSLKVFNCEELEQIIEKDQTSSQYHHRLQPICFPNLIQISIRNCENLKCLLPISVAHCGLPKLQFLSLVKLSNLVSFSPVGCHFFFPFLRRLEIKDCPNITTSFSVDSKQSVHVKTEASQLVDGIIVEEAATTHGTTWPIGSDILWPYGDEEESEAEI